MRWCYWVVHTYLLEEVVRLGTQVVLRVLLERLVQENIAHDSLSSSHTNVQHNVDQMHVSLSLTPG